jgi:hypothetical protein
MWRNGVYNIITGNIRYLFCFSLTGSLNRKGLQCVRIVSWVILAVILLGTLTGGCSPVSIPGGESQPSTEKPVTETPVKGTPAEPEETPLSDFIKISGEESPALGYYRCR